MNCNPRAALARAMARIQGMDFSGASALISDPSMLDDMATMEAMQLQTEEAWANEFHQMPPPLHHYPSMAQQLNFQQPHLPSPAGVENWLEQFERMPQMGAEGVGMHHQHSTMPFTQTQHEHSSQIMQQSVGPQKVITASLFAPAQNEEFLFEQAFDQDDWASHFHAMHPEETGENWTNEFNEEGVKTFGIEGEPLISLEQKNAESKFYDFMSKIGSGGILIDDEHGQIIEQEGINENERDPMEEAWANQLQSQPPPQAWASKFNGHDLSVELGEGGVWAKDFATSRDQEQVENEVRKQGTYDEDEEGNLQELGDNDWAREMSAVDVVMPADIEDVWKEATVGEYGELEGAWSEVEKERNNGGELYIKEEELNPEKELETWAEEYKNILQNVDDSTTAGSTAFVHGSVYPFNDNNSYLFHDNPFAEGVELLSAGILSEAILAFEAACQKNPECFDSWKLLGTTQAENENDRLAIVALHHANEINPRDDAVYIALASSEANEGIQSMALNTLQQMVMSNPAYEQVGNLLAEQPAEHFSNLPEDMNEFAAEYLTGGDEIGKIETLFNAAIELNPQDSSLFVGLGILNHISHNYESASENFKRALDIKPDDPKLWNKLGATLASNSQVPEALTAYNRALDINPGFVRAQYNIGVAYNNLGDYSTSAREILKAILAQQREDGRFGDIFEAGGEKGKDPREMAQAAEMWNTLRMVLERMGRNDFARLTERQDIKSFIQEFGLSELIM